MFQKTKDANGFHSKKNLTLLEMNFCIWTKILYKAKKCSKDESKILPRI